MARIFQFGAEYGYRPSWVAGGALVNGYSSGKAIEIDYPGDTSTAIYPASANPTWPKPTEIYFRARIKSSIPTSGYNGFDIRDQYDDRIIRGHGGTIIEDSAGTELVNGTAWSATGYARLEIYLQCANPGNCIILKNGTEIFNGTGNFLPNPDSYVNKITFGIAYPVEMRIDDIAINDTSGSYNNSWCGNSHIFGKRPGGSGTSEWSRYPNAGEENYEDIDETGTPDEDDYVQAALDEVTDLYEFQDLGFGVVNAVSLVLYGKMSSPGAMGMRLKVSTSGSVRSSDRYQPNDSYYPHMFLFDQPGGDGPWTYEKFDASLFGYESEGA